jgi:hypothetical protein
VLISCVIFFPGMMLPCWFPMCNFLSWNDALEFRRWEGKLMRFGSLGGDYVVSYSIALKWCCRGEFVWVKLWGQTGQVENKCDKTSDRRKQTKFFLWCCRADFLCVISFPFLEWCCRANFLCVISFPGLMLTCWFSVCNFLNWNDALDFRRWAVP